MRCKACDRIMEGRDFAPYKQTFFEDGDHPATETEDLCGRCRQHIKEALKGGSEEDDVRHFCDYYYREFDEYVDEWYSVVNSNGNSLMDRLWNSGETAT